MVPAISRTTKNPLRGGFSYTAVCVVILPIESISSHRTAQFSTVKNSVVSMQNPPRLNAPAALSPCRNYGFSLSAQVIYACLPIIARVMTEKRCRRGGAV